VSGGYEENVLSFCSLRFDLIELVRAAVRPGTRTLHDRQQPWLRYPYCLGRMLHVSSLTPIYNVLSLTGKLRKVKLPEASDERANG